MKFDTNSRNIMFEHNNADLSFLVYKIFEMEVLLHRSNDPDTKRLYRILTVLLSINKYITIEFIESIEREDDYSLKIVSNTLPVVCRIIQSKKFIRAIEDTVTKFSSSCHYNIILANIDEARKVTESFIN